MSADVLVPLPVALPMLMAAFLAGAKKFIPRRAADLLTIFTTIAVGLICGALTYYTVPKPIVYWFGGWTPRWGTALGICFVATPIACGFAALVSTLMIAALVFSWRYFDTIRTLFHVLML